MFGALEILYLFLAGTGAGLCLATSALGLLSPRDEVSVASLSSASGRVRLCTAVSQPYRIFLAPALGIAAACVVIGSLSLVFSLGRPEMAIGIFLSSGFTWSNFGAMSLVACIVLCALQALMVAGYLPSRLWVLRVVEALSSVASLAVALYTGFLLYDMSGIPFWHSAFLPVLFMLSSISCGFGALLFISMAFRSMSEFRTLISSMFNIDLAVVVLEAIALICFIFIRPTAGEGQEAASTAIASLVSGDLSLWFWAVFVGCGLVLPLSVEIGCRFVRPRNLEAVAAMLAIAVLIGGFALRYCIVIAGAHPYLGVAVNTL